MYSKDKRRTGCQSINERILTIISILKSLFTIHTAMYERQRAKKDDYQATSTLSKSQIEYLVSYKIFYLHVKAINRDILSIKYMFKSRMKNFVAQTR